MYQPEMSEENIRKLYLLKLLKKRPMTELLNQILGEYFQKHEQDGSGEGGKEEPTSAKSAETHSEPNRSTRKRRTTTTSDTGIAFSSEPGNTPRMTNP